MIVDPAGAPAVPKSPDEPAAAACVAALAQHPATFRWDPERAGVDVAATTDTVRGPNRARAKVFAPRAGTTCVFLYKDSRLPFSDDRFGYGAMIFKGRPPLSEDLEALLLYLDSGLDPTLRPPALKRAFPFTIPR
jgi:hypothetical protein